uniref:hypothetical protein n=1 Tax=Flavobacterium sp. TaxID=239 RepID=UPI00404920E9
MIKNDFLNQNISEDSVGDLTIGMSFDVFEEKFLKPELFYYEKTIVMNAVFPSHVTYIFFDSICCWIDIRNSTLERIDLYNNFKGKFNKKISLGKKLGVIKELNLPLIFDEDCVQIAKNWTVSLIVDKDLTILNSIEEVYNSKIEMITIKK